MILTGDLHASPEELQYLNPRYLKGKYGSKCENTFIFILGDGGFLWYEDKYSDFNGELINTLNDWMKELNSILIVVPGNHENYKRIYSLPKISMDRNCKGEFREISPYIRYTERYGEYTFEGKEFLILGGARSIDKIYRHEGEWFPDETFSIEEKDIIISLIKDNEYDYVLSHTCPDYIACQIFGTVNYRDSNSEFFDKVMNYISPKAWFFGHFHPEKIQGEYNFGNFDNLKINDTKFKCLYKSIQDVI